MKIVNVSFFLFFSTFLVIVFTLEAEDCLRKAYFNPSISNELKRSNTSDLQNHYDDLLQMTKPFRNLDRTKMQNFDDSLYSSQAMEEFWVANFCCDYSLNNFGGYIPIFVKWVTTHMRNKDKQLLNILNSKLHKDVLYITISNHAFGIIQSGINLQKFPNILVLSAGGNGHIPIPHLKRDIPYQPYFLHFNKMKNNNNNDNSFFKFDISFVGTPRSSGGRNFFLDSLKNIAKNEKSNNLIVEITQKSFRDTLKVYNTSLLNLCPRGVGRTSFRLYEVIHIGRLPIYIYSDIPWIPYENTIGDMQRFGWIFQNADSLKIVSLAKRLKNNSIEIVKRLDILKSVRNSHYTYNGVKNQIWKYLKDGEKLSDLRCHGYPIPG